MTKSILLASAALLTLAACSSSVSDAGCTYTPLLGTVGSCDDVVDDGTTAGTDNGTGATAKLLSTGYSASRIEYDTANDQLIVESLPFDDDVFEGRYDRVASSDVPGYKAYSPTNGNLDNYIAYYGTSSTGNVSSAIVAQGGYADHGHAGAGYARSGSVNLPSTTQRAFYNGSYVGLRTVADPTVAGGIGPIDIIKGDVQMEADFSDNKLRGFIVNRLLTQDESKVGLSSSVTLIEGNIDRTEAIVSDGTINGTINGEDLGGTWQALFGGPDGGEVAGVVVITHGEYRETGSIIAEQ